MKKKHFEVLNKLLCVFILLTWINISGLANNYIENGTEEKFIEIVKDAVVNKKGSFTIIQTGYYDYDKQINNIIKKVNDKTLAKANYYAIIVSSNERRTSNRVQYTYELQYKTVDRYNDAPIFFTYKQVYDYITNEIDNKSVNSNIVIKNYNPKKFYLGEILYKIHKEYGIDIFACNMVHANNDYFEICFNYGDNDWEDKDKKIIKSEDEWYKSIKEALQNGTYQIDFSGTYSYPLDNKTVDLVLAHNPEYNDWVTSKSLKYDASGGKLIIHKTLNKSETKNRANKVNNCAEKIVKKIIKKGMSEEEKFKAIYKYLIYNCSYDTENYKRNTVPEDSNTVYGALIKGKAVCQGYTAAFNRLAKEIGLTSIGVCGMANNGTIIEKHAWNKIKIGNKKFYIDATWGKPEPKCTATHKFKNNNGVTKVYKLSKTYIKNIGNGKKVRYGEYNGENGTIYILSYEYTPYEYFAKSAKIFKKNHYWEEKDYSSKYFIDNNS